MSATLVTRPWSLPSQAPRALGREASVPDGAQPVGAMQWVLGRRVDVAPRQLTRLFVALCGVSLAMAVVVDLQGSPHVLALTLAQLAAVGVTMRLIARHIGDHETLTLSGSRLRVEQCFGRRTRRTEFAAECARVEPAAGQGSLVEISGDGRKVRVGRFLRSELRAGFAQELRRALRRAPQGVQHEMDSN